jgi:UDP-N-acetylmuramoyl-L-alanyl-D-glutamate--2,6-diaminopimelate ligase
MKLKKLFKDFDVAQIKGAKELEITGICSHSKLASPGNLFIAKRGLIDDGAAYISEAIQAGVIAILTDMYDPSLKTITQIIHPHPSQIEGALAAQYYQNPSEALFMAALTGTNGKTTTSYLTKYLLDTLEKDNTGLIGTIEYLIGTHRYQAARTTPDVLANQKMLREMCHQGIKSCVMEVTSHALAQTRVDSIHFDVALFTNLTQDHLDYHKTMEEYCSAKNRLFKSLHQSKKTSPCAIVNIDSPWTEKILEGCRAKILTYGINNPSDLSASDIKLTPDGTKFLLHYKENNILCHIPLVGRFNVYNCLAATAICLVKGHPLHAIASLFPSLPAVSGRLEPVKNNLGLKVLVDFAHSDDALRNVLESLTELKTGKIITVFGCGGDRDKTKRPKMAKAAEQYSDLCLVTSDNPRGEDPEKIAQEIVGGFSSNAYIVELDRKKAIELALQRANPGDIILIAGKGHETYQIFAHKTVEFDDRKAAFEILNNLAAVHG